MTDTILIPPDRMQEPIRVFVENSALRFCTDVEFRADDSLAVVASWPVAGFSSGEQVAWSLLASLVSGDLRAAFDRLDARNIAALMQTLNSLHGLVSA